MKYILYPFLCSLLLIACSHGDNKKTNSLSAFKPTAMDSAYGKIRPQLQHFTVNTGKTNIIKASNGTEIMLPAECFVNADGEIIKGNVQVEIVEAFSLKDFISSGLATISNDKLLISNGMMYINAKAGDEQLQVKKETPLTVSMPTMNSNNGFQMFMGDGTNWNVDSTMTEEEYAITLPLNLLYPEGNKELYYCITYFGSKDETYHIYDSSIMNVTAGKYENTIIATGEFKRRYYSLVQMMNSMSYFINRDYYYKQNCENRKFNYDIFKVYFDHPNRSFRELDSIAKKMYTDYFKMNKERIAAFCDSVNVYLRSYYSNWTDTNYYFDFRKTSLEEDYMGVLKYFPPKDTKEIRQFNNHGVNLNNANAFEQLKTKGIDTKEINDLLTYNYKRQNMIKILQKQKDAIADRDKLSKMYESTVFSVTKMGWINCDRFFDDPSAGKAEMYVSNMGTSLPFMDYSLVIPDMNVRLSAYEQKPGIYSFTQKDGRYIKLPVGKAAVVIGVSVQHDSVFFASKKITIKDGLIINLPIQYIDKATLGDSLSVALK